MDDILAEVMVSGKRYNVKQNTWHAALLSQDASILIVENQDTGEDNLLFFRLKAEQKQVILGLECHH